MLKKLKQKINFFIESLGESNESAFGNGGLDCCDLNAKKKGKKR